MIIPKLLNKKERKAQASLVTGLVFGMASLIIGVIISFVIVSTLNDASLLTSSRTTATTTNEDNGAINSTGYVLTQFNQQSTVSCSITDAVNQTSGGAIASGNFTLTATTCNVVNASAEIWQSVTFNYTVLTESAEEQSTDNLVANYTAGIDNVSEKVPTVLLVAAIVLILGVLGILVAVWQRMKLTEGSSL